jgi:TIR domain
MPFHVFLSHSSTDKPAVEELARRLAGEGIQAWLDKWNLIPGDPWQPAIEKLKRPWPNLKLAPSL